MLAELLLVSSSTNRTLTMWPVQIQYTCTDYVDQTFWMAEQSFFAKSVKRNPDYMACIENSVSSRKLIRICWILLLDVQYALDIANV